MQLPNLLTIAELVCGRLTRVYATMHRGTPMSTSATIQVRAVLLEEGDWWAAQCLEYDIAAQAPSRAALVLELQRVLIAHITVSRELGREPFKNLPKAPQRYWDMFDAAKAQGPVDEISSSPPGLPKVVTQTRFAHALAA
jgi:hypothetical protein